MDKPGRRPSPPRKPENVYVSGPSTPSDEAEYGNYGTPFEYGESVSSQSRDTGRRPTDYGTPYEPRDSVASQSPILPIEKGDDNDSRTKCLRIAVIGVVVALLVIIISVTLGIQLTKSVHLCSACDCEASLLTGRVTDTFGRPLSDATVAYVEPNATYATTDVNGRFLMSGVCATPQLMRVTKSRYSTVVKRTTCRSFVDEGNCTSTLDVQIERIDLPFIFENPNSKYRITGQSVTFCCDAESTSPTRYEWLKNDVIIEDIKSDEQKLTLTKLQESDSGYYKCRVHNAAGAVLSDRAKLTVTESPTGCDTEPSTHIIKLPEDCIQASTNRAEYDIGTCETKRCSGKVSDQTLCLDAESESYCCRETGTKGINIQCQGYTLPMSKIISCGCAQCTPKSNTIIGRVVSTGKGGAVLNSIMVYYNNKNVTSTDDRGQFVITITDTVLKVPLTFRDPIYSRVLDTTVVFQVNRGSPRYVVVEMITAGEKVISFDSTIGTRLPILDSNGTQTAMATLLIAANSVYKVSGDIYNGTVYVMVNDIDMRNRDDAELAPGDFSAIDEHGHQVKLMSFGMFALQFTDPSGNPLSVAGVTIILNSELFLPACIEAECDTKLWILNSKSGVWELASIFTKSEDLPRAKRQRSIIIGHLELFEFEWYAIGDIDRKQRCWAKVIGYRANDFNPSSILPSVYQVKSVLEINQENQMPQTAQFYRVSSHSSTTNYGSVGFCVPLACNDPVSNINAFLSATANTNTYLDPASPRENGSYYSLDETDRDQLRYYISYHKNSEIWVIPQPSGIGPIYQGNDAGYDEGICSEADTGTKHFQFSCETCDDVVCHTYQTTALSPTSRTFRMFYPVLVPSIQTIQSYCSIGIRIITNSSAVNITATSEDSDGRFYGRRSIVARKTNVGLNYIDACMEYKCSGKVYEGKTSKHDITKITVDVKDKNGACTLKQMPSGFQTQSQLDIPVRFTDPQIYGADTGLHKFDQFFSEPVCVNDINSPQTTTTENCQINEEFVLAVEVYCI